MCGVRLAYPTGKKRLAQPLDLDSSFLSAILLKCTFGLSAAHYCGALDFDLKERRAAQTKERRDPVRKHSEYFRSQELIEKRLGELGSKLGVRDTDFLQAIGGLTQFTHTRKGNRADGART